MLSLRTVHTLIVTKEDLQPVTYKYSKEGSLITSLGSQIQFLYRLLNPSRIVIPLPLPDQPGDLYFISRLVPKQLQSPRQEIQVFPVCQVAQRVESRLVVVASSLVVVAVNDVDALMGQKWWLVGLRAVVANAAAQVRRIERRKILIVMEFVGLFVCLFLQNMRVGSCRQDCYCNKDCLLR